MTERENLWEYFAQREEELIRLREGLKRELDHLRQARAAIEGTPENNEKSGEKLTIKDMVRSVLRDHPEGGSYDQIINWISAKHNADIARTSLSPQLSRLKAEDEIDLSEDSGVWRLKPSDQKNRYYQLHGRSRKPLSHDEFRIKLTQRRD